MGVLIESWCFCKGVSKSDKLKASIFNTKSSALASISSSTIATAFLIHRNLLLTTHVNIPSVSAAVDISEIRLHNGLTASLFPHRFFITSSVLDLTIVGLDTVDADSISQGQQHSHYLKTCSKPTLDLGSIVYLLGYTEKNKLTVGQGKVVVATDNLIKLSTDGSVWSPGSAGFDSQGNLAFMICDPMKLATSPNNKSSSTSSSSTSSWKKDIPLQFGIPIPVICDWLNQHWEGSLDELTKPKLPIIRLMSSGQKSEHSCASFTMRQVFKPTEVVENDGTPSSSKAREPPGPTSSAVAEEIQTRNPLLDMNTHVQGILTPQIYESPKLTAVPVRPKSNSPKQLLDINFPPRVSKAVMPHFVKPVTPFSDENFVTHHIPMREENQSLRPASPDAAPDVSSTGSVNGAQSEVQSSSSPQHDIHNEYSSEGETTMYSAETAESRNYTSPRETKFQQVGRSQSYMGYNRWGPTQRNPMARSGITEKQRSFARGKSQGATSQRSGAGGDYISPTVSSIMKKRNNMEQQQPSRPRQSAVHSSPRWVF
ncbi:hypothetical protein ACFE04_002679 [Oxalis oulophora]